MNLFCWAREMFGVESQYDKYNQKIQWCRRCCKNLPQNSSKTQNSLYILFASVAPSTLWQLFRLSFQRDNFVMFFYCIPRTTCRLNTNVVNHLRPIPPSNPRLFVNPMLEPINDWRFKKGWAARNQPLTWKWSYKTINSWFTWTVYATHLRQEVVRR